MPGAANGPHQTFNKTMSNFVSNQSLNLNGQKLLISSSQQPASTSGHHQATTQNQSSSNLSNHLNMQQLQ